VKATESWAPRSNSGKFGKFPIVGLLFELAADSARGGRVFSIADWFISGVSYLAFSGFGPYSIQLDSQYLVRLLTMVNGTKGPTAESRDSIEALTGRDFCGLAPSGDSALCAETRYPSRHIRAKGVLFGSECPP